MRRYLVVLLACLASIQLIDAGRRTSSSRSSSSSSRSSSSRRSSSGGSSTYSRSSLSGGTRSGGTRNSGSRTNYSYYSRSPTRSRHRRISCRSRNVAASNATSSGMFNTTSNYTMKGYGTRWGTDFTNVSKNVDYSNKKVGLGAGPGFIGGARSGPVPTLAVYHRYNKYRDLMYGHRYGYGIGGGPYGDDFGLMNDPSYYIGYYLADRCTHACPYPSVCRHGLCVCDFGYTRRWGRCSRDWSTNPYRPLRNIDPTMKCVNNEMCQDYDFNLICNWDGSVTTGRCQCRNDMHWNTEKHECQLFLDVDCSCITYDTRVDPLISEAVDATENRTENYNQTDGAYGAVDLTLSREYNLKTSLLESIDPRVANEDQLREAFCRDVDAFSYEFNDIYHSNDGVSSKLPGKMDRDPSIGEYFLEAIDLMNRTHWRFFLPDDTDIDRDGNLSDLEVQHKFNSYMGELFELIDDDKDNSITEEELRSLKLDIPQLTKAIDIALENFPLRPFFLAADGNGDGFYDENDFYHPENMHQNGFGNVSDLHLVGGKDSSSGDIFFGKKGMVCHNWDRDEHDTRNAEVICRQLGFLGVIRLTYPSMFTQIFPSHSDMRLHKMFACNGTEKSLTDCPYESFDCNDELIYGVICKTDNRSKIDRGLNELIGWDLSEGHDLEKYKIWEAFGRFLFVGDSNGDGKLSLEELAMKAKELITKILEFFDGNQDGKISLDDFTSPNLPVGSVHNLMTELFDDVTAGQGELDLLQYLDKNRLVKTGLKRYDINKDKKLNAADAFWRLNSREKTTFLIPMVSQKLDKNQDGKIQQEELRQFIDDLFNRVDVDKDVALTLGDAYSFMRENGFDCFQVGALRSFIKVLLHTVDTQTRNFFGYVFKQLDMDGNGQITPQELEKMHIPCDMSGRHVFCDMSSVTCPEDNDYNFNNSSGPNARLSCEQMFHTFFDLGDLFRGFPDLEMDFRRHGGYGGGGHHQPQKETILDKMTNTACEMLY